MPSFSCHLSSSEPPVTCALDGRPVTTTTAGLSLLRGARVLARRETDGLYYLGHIACEVEGSCDRFLVEFEKCRALKGRGQFRMQETPICDIIHYEDARWRPLAPGDHVLAPVDGNMEKYGPGTVLQGAESRVCGLAFEDSDVLVTFWNGRTKTIAPGLAIWIPQKLSDRITLELHIPLEARKKLMESCPGFPFIGSNDKQSGREIEEKASGSHDCLYCRPSTGVCQKCHVPEELWAALRTSLNHISQMTSSKEKPPKKVDKDKEPRQEPSSKPVPYKEKAKSQKKSVGDRKVHQEWEQKERRVCSRDTQTEKNIAQDIPIRSNDKTTRGDTINSRYKPSASSPDHMTHLQATLHRIDRAMRDDRLAMESALLQRRPRSTPLKLNEEDKAPRDREQRDRRNVGQQRRIQEEQRNRRREEKNLDMEEEEETQQDHRLRSEQRILLDLERRQDSEGLEAQQVESCDRGRHLERESWRGDQRVRFHSDLQQQREDMDLEVTRKPREKKDERPDGAQSRVGAQRRQEEADRQDWRRHRQLQTGSGRAVSKRLEQFYRQAERETQEDTDLQQYLKNHNLQAVRSAMVL